MRSFLRSLTCLTVALLFPITSFAIHDEPGGPKDIGNSAPPGIGGNGPYTSLNMDLLGHLPLNQIGGGQGNVLGNGGLLKRLGLLHQTSHRVHEPTDAAVR